MIKDSAVDSEWSLRRYFYGNRWVTKLKKLGVRIDYHA